MKFSFKVIFSLIFVYSSTMMAAEIKCKTLVDQYVALELQNFQNQDNQIPVCSEKITSNCCPIISSGKTHCTVKEIEYYYQNLIAEVEILEGFGKLANTIEGQHSLIKNKDQKLDQKLNTINDFEKNLEYADFLQQSLYQGEVWVNFYKQEEPANLYFQNYCKDSKNNFCDTYRTIKDQNEFASFLNDFAQAEKNYIQTHQSESQTSRFKNYANHLAINGHSVEDYKEEDDFKTIKSLKDKIRDAQEDKQLSDDEIKSIVQLSEKLNSISVNGANLASLTPSERITINLINHSAKKLSEFHDDLTGKKDLLGDIQKINTNMKNNIKEQADFIERFSTEINIEIKREGDVCTQNGCGSPTKTNNEILLDSLLFHHNRTNKLKEMANDIGQCLENKKKVSDFKLCYNQFNNDVINFSSANLNEKVKELQKTKNLLQFALNDHPTLSKQEKIKYLTLKALKENGCHNTEFENQIVDICKVKHGYYNNTISGFISENKEIFFNYENEELRKLLDLKKNDYEKYSSDALEILNNCENKSFSALCEQLKKEALKERRRIESQFEITPLPKQKKNKPEVSTGEAIALGAFSGATRSLPSFFEYMTFKNRTETLLNSYTNYNQSVINWNNANPDKIYIMPDYSNPIYQTPNTKVQYWNPSSFRLPSMNFGQFDPLSI
jgi:hypothetical protein